jgi:hypothetical protein
MKCEMAQEQVVLMAYGELDGEPAGELEQHLEMCEACRRELHAMLALEESMALVPMLEPSPNLLAQSRMRLDDALDGIPAGGWTGRLRSNLFGWIRYVQGSPALTTLLLGVGFLGGDFTHRYQVAHAPKLPAPVVIRETLGSSIANVSGIVQTPNSELVQVKYNRVVPETMEGSLDQPEIRQLLMMGMKAGTNNGVRVDSVALLANECRSGHECAGTVDGTGIRGALMQTLRYDKDAGVRMKALEGLQRFVDQDQRVRDAVLEALMRDPNAGVRKTAIGLLEPVGSDSSVRQVLRTVSTQDENPYIRTASFEALQGSGDIQ